jgi:hypothetical protein
MNKKIRFLEWEWAKVVYSVNAQIQSASIAPVRQSVFIKERLKLSDILPENRFSGIRLKLYYKHKTQKRRQISLN